MVSNLLLSLIRTWVPIGVGALISWLASLGIDVDTQTKGSLVIAMTALITGLYYTLVRLLERRYPQLGFLLGTPVQPVYTVARPSPVADNPVVGTPPAPPAV